MGFGAGPTSPGGPFYSPGGSQPCAASGGEIPTPPFSGKKGFSKKKTPTRCPERRGKLRHGRPRGSELSPPPQKPRPWEAGGTPGSPRAPGNSLGALGVAGLGDKDSGNPRGCGESGVGGGGSPPFLGFPGSFLEAEPTGGLGGRWPCPVSPARCHTRCPRVPSKPGAVPAPAGTRCPGRAGTQRAASPAWGHGDSPGVSRGSGDVPCALLWGKLRHGGSAPRVSRRSQG